MKTKYFLVLMIAGLLLGGCATVNVSSDYDRSANFSSLKTYDWAGPQPITGNPRLDNDILHERIRTAVEREMAAKGFQKAAASPDFKIAYHVGLEEKLDVTTFQNYDYTYSPSFHPFHHNIAAMPASETYVYQYEEGTLLLDIVDPTTKQLIWRGSASTEVNQTASPEKREAKINKAVNKLLSQFPPQ